MACFYQFKKSVEDLYAELASFIPSINNIQKLKTFIGKNCNIMDKFKLLVRASLLAQLPPDHTRVIKTFYEVSFKVFCNLEDDKDQLQNSNSCLETVQCKGCLQEMDQCQCQRIYEIFCDTNRYKNKTEIWLILTISQQY